MATVWAAHIAPRIGQWQQQAYETGWSHTFRFSSLTHLVNQMSYCRGLRERHPTAPLRTMRPPRPDSHEYGQVTRLGIVAHGDREGVVELDRHLTADSMPSFATELEELSTYLTPDAKVIFYSCIAGAGIDGDRLLNTLSVRLRGQTIIGFTVFGETDASEALSAIAPQSPGRVREAPHGRGTGRSGREGLLGPWSIYAKWSLNGAIVRRPIIG
jgi:hypothetical protein